MRLKLVGELKQNNISIPNPEQTHLMNQSF